MGITNQLRRTLGLFGVYRRSKALAFLVDHSREVKRLRREPQKAADEAHLRGTWNFDNPVERAWHRHVFEAVSTQLGTERWGDVLEVGCSEGIFTEQLAPVCRSVTACDISPVAVARAAERCGRFPSVGICQVDAATEEINCQYDVVFVMDVLWFVVGTKRKERILHHLVQAVRDGGLLVFSDSRMPKQMRHSFWSLFFRSGADEWTKRLERVPGLAVVRKEAYPPSGRSTPGYWDKLFVLFQKRSGQDAALIS